MLKHWDTHAEYQHFISEAVALLNPSQLKKLYSLSDSWNKLTSMNPLGNPSLSSNPEGTEEYIKTYNNRTSSERVNNRVSNDYHLHDMKIHSKKTVFFFLL